MNEPDSGDDNINNSANRTDTAAANVPSGMTEGAPDLINFDTAQTQDANKPLIDLNPNHQTKKDDESDEEPVSPPSALSKSDDEDEKPDKSDSDDNE